MIKIHYITNLAPLYRKNLWLSLVKQESFKVDFFFGSGSSGIASMTFTPEEAVFFKDNIHRLNNFWLRKKTLLWQSGTLARSFFSKPDLVILLGEFVILSNWLSAIIYRIRGIKVVIYGHGMYGDEKGVKHFLRKTYYRLANAHLVYEKRGKQIMTKNGFEAEDIYVFYNSLDYDKQLAIRESVNKINPNIAYPFFEKPELPTLLFIGRLTKEKKLNYLIEITKLLESKEILVNLLIIGAGEDEEKLKVMASKNLAPNRTHFFGACHDEKTLGKLIFNADLCISPGNVGLTAIHSFSYGTPVATHSNFLNQGPEVESIVDGKTGFLFEEDNIDDLFKKTRDWLSQNKIKRDKRRLDCYKVVDTNYNPNYQLKVFKKMIGEQLT